MEAHKVNVVNTLQLIASVEEQDKYDRDVAIANVAHELVNQWFDDYFLIDYEWFKELFDENEWRILIEFHEFYNQLTDDLPDAYAQLKSDKSWKLIMEKANWALDALGWNGLEAVYEVD